MAADHLVSLTIDHDAGVAYLRFSGNQIACTVELDEYLNIDLDEHDVAVGIELLDLERSIPLDDLVKRFHIRSEALATLVQAMRYSKSSHGVTGLMGKAPSLTLSV